jgi:hypothetical protein
MGLLDGVVLAVVRIESRMTFASLRAYGIIVVS